MALRCAPARIGCRSFIQPPCLRCRSVRSPIASIPYGSATRLVSLSPAVRPIDVRMYCDPGNRVILSSGGRLFVLGQCTRRMPARTGEFQFVPASGDDVSLIVSRSMISWPTPFEINFMTGAAPSWETRFVLPADMEKAVRSTAHDAVALRAGLLSRRRLDRRHDDPRGLNRPPSTLAYTCSPLGSFMLALSLSSLPRIFFASPLSAFARTRNFIRRR